MVQPHPEFTPQVRRNEQTGIVTIGLGRETAFIVLAPADAVEFACEILQHTGGHFKLRVEFPDGRDSIDCDHEADECSNHSSS